MVDNAIKLAQQVDSGGIMTANQQQQQQPPSTTTLYEDLSYDTFLSTPNSSLNNNNNNENSKYSSLLKLYEYQIVEMQHEYELLLEDKVHIINSLNFNFIIHITYEFI